MEFTLIREWCLVLVYSFRMLSLYYLVVCRADENTQRKSCFAEQNLQTAIQKTLLSGISKYTDNDAEKV